jgi:hypothetical protein
VLLLSVLGLDIELESVLIELESVLIEPFSLGGAIVLSVVTPVDGELVLVLS